MRQRCLPEPFGAGRAWCLQQDQHLRQRCRTHISPGIHRAASCDWRFHYHLRKARTAKQLAGWAPGEVSGCRAGKTKFFKSLLTAQSSWTYNDPADDAAVARHLRSASLEFLGHTATQLKNWVEDVSLLNVSLACCLTIKSEERETWTARSLRDASLLVCIEKRLWRSRLSSSSTFSGLLEIDVLGTRQKRCINVN